MQLLATRLYPPRSDGGIVARSAGPRLAQFAQSRRLTLIKAPAGYGKTTLMVECYSHLISGSHSAIWISLSEFDGSIDEFAAYLARALSAHGLAPSDLPPDLSVGGATVRSICARFDPIFDGLPGALYIFLDDANAIRGCAAETLLAALIKESGDKVHWIVGSRSALAVPLARMRVLGQFGELDVEDLRFSRVQTHEFLSLKAAGSVSEALARFSHERTEGWPAGLQLMSIALERSGGDEASLIERCASRKRDVAAFFREEIFARLDEVMQEFLLHTCVLDRFTASLCDAMTGRNDGQRMIEGLEEGGLFVFALDEDNRWYRYHPLFAEFLVGILRDREPGIESALHLHASRWLGAQGLVGEAIEHAIQSGDEPYAAQFLDQVLHSLMRNGEIVRSARLVSSLTEKTLNRFPKVQLWRVMCMTVESRFGEARRLLSELERQFDKLETDSDIDPLQLREWRHILLNRRMVLALFCDDIDEMERLGRELQSREAQAREEEPDVFLQYSLQMSQLTARRERYRLHECGDLIADIRELLTSGGYRSMLVWYTCNVGLLLMQRGEATAAAAQYRDAVELARSCSQTGADSELLSMSMTMLADALLESNECQEAKALFERADRCASGIGTPEYWVARYVGRARLAFFEADMASAAQSLDEGYEVAVARRLERLRWAITHERIRQALALADVRTAQRIGMDAGLPEEEAELRPSANVTTLQELKAVTWSRLAIATGRHAEALRLLRAWMGFVERSAPGAVVRFSVLAARALHAAGDSRGALRMIQQAVDHAGRAGTILSILQEGEPIRSLAIKSLEGADAARAPAPFHRRLNDALEIRTPLFEFAVSSGGREEICESLAPVEPLTQREIDILCRVARSMLYKEIADQLGLTENSVKWYMQQIYGKLGVRRRQRAVEKGRLLGYVRTVASDARA